MSGFSAARKRMVDGQLRPNNVTDRRVLAAMLTVPREAFVPVNRRALTYLDLDLDVAEEGATKRLLIRPSLTARLLQAAAIGETDNVLVVGCASGYMAALAAKLAARVTATEGDSALALKAKRTLAALSVNNVSCKVADVAEGDPDGAPYSAIILNGATEVTPSVLLGQLRGGGRLVGVSAETVPQQAMVVTVSHGRFGYRMLFEAAAPVVPGLEKVAAFVF